MKNNKIPLLYDCQAKVLLVVLFFLCNIVVQSSFRRNPKTIFFHDKELLVKGNIFRKVCCQFLELDCNPKAVTPPTIIFSTMQSENPIVTNSTYANVTPIEQILVNNHFNLKKPFDFFKCYMYMLPYFKTANDAFGFVNSVAFKRHQSFTFLNLNSLKSTIYA
jgi:hypothetical protein